MVIQALKNRESDTTSGNKHLAAEARLWKDKLEFVTDRHSTSQTIKATPNFHKAKVFCTFPRNLWGFPLKLGHKFCGYSPEG